MPLQKQLHVVQISSGPDNRVPKKGHANIHLQEHGCHGMRQGSMRIDTLHQTHLSWNLYSSPCEQVPAVLRILPRPRLYYDSAYIVHSLPPVNPPLAAPEMSSLPSFSLIHSQVSTLSFPLAANLPNITQINLPWTDRYFDTRQGCVEGIKIRVATFKFNHLFNRTLS